MELKIPVTYKQGKVKEQSDVKIMFDDELGSAALFGQSGHLRDRTPLLTSPLCF